MLVSFQIAAVAPAVASVVALLSSDATSEHCACCKKQSTTDNASGATASGATASDATAPMTTAQSDAEDCGGCPTGQPCTDCPAGCASCHSASSVRLLPPAAFMFAAALGTSFDNGVISEQSTPSSPFLISLDRPPKGAVAV